MKEIKGVLDRYKQEIHISNDSCILENIVVYDLYDFINGNNELKKEFNNRVSDESVKNDNESAAFISSKFKEFLIFCAERRHIKGYEKFFKENNKMFSYSASSYGAQIFDAVEIRKLDIAYGEASEKARAAKIKDFSLVVIRYLINFLEENNNIDKNQNREFFEVAVKDREIRINNYILSRPFATGINYEFLEFIRRQKKDRLIERKCIDEAIGDGIRGARFIKLLNNLGFKGEVKKAFFYKVNKCGLYYRGDKITREDLEKAGVDMGVLIKELELADLKCRKSPK